MRSASANNWKKETSFNPSDNIPHELFLFNSEKRNFPLLNILIENFHVSPMFICYKKKRRKNSNLAERSNRLLINNINTTNPCRTFFELPPVYRGT